MPLLVEDELALAGDAQAVCFAGMSNADLGVTLEKLRTLENAKPGFNSPAPLDLYVAGDLIRLSVSEHACLP
jgi:hypothetical protein